MQVEALGHAVLKVRSLEQAEAFYTGILGIPIATRHEEAPMTFFTLGNHHDLALLEVGEAAPRPPAGATGLYHVAFKIGESLDELRASGTVGERYDGYAQAVQSSAADVVKQVNAKRMQIYAERASQEGVSADQIGRVYRSGGQWFQLSKQGVGTDQRRGIGGRSGKLRAPRNLLIEHRNRGIQPVLRAGGHNLHLLAGPGSRRRQQSRCEVEHLVLDRAKRRLRGGGLQRRLCARVSIGVKQAQAALDPGKRREIAA